VERFVVHGETSTRSQKQSAEQVEIFRAVCAPFEQWSDALFIRGDRCDDSSPSPGPYPILAEETGSSRGTSRKAYHAAVECRLVGGRKETGICLAGGIED
jgi:hypothetical protein